jgi:phosphatidylglycerophosphatase A
LALAWILLAWWGTPGLLVGFAVVSVAGLWAAGRAAVIVGRKDPGVVVVDEVAGQLLTLAFHPPTWPVLACGFFLFRVFDVVKPPPARQAESLPGGSGIMADDWIAGVYANLSLHALAWAFPAWLGTR